MPYTFAIPAPGANAKSLSVTVEQGESLIFIGANGSGKTRLAVYLEHVLPPDSVQRIAAQKNLALNDKIQIISFDRAQNMLRIGHPDTTHKGNKHTYRWGGEPAIHQLSDFDALLQMLFAEHNKIASKHLSDHAANPNVAIPETSLGRLKRAWEALLPHRNLEVDEGLISAVPSAGSGGKYVGSQMSDGERAIFYFLGQCLAAPKNGVIILDEPEGHINKAILGPLWDAAEALRPDCAFVYITHDVDFAASRTASAKYFLRAYTPAPSETWEIELLPEDIGLPAPVVAELVGSRKPILFIEGTRGSVDLTIYRRLYSRFTVVPVGSCAAVIGSVASYDASKIVHWLDARGIVDSDHRQQNEIDRLKSFGVFVLPVAEIENLLLLPEVFLALAESYSCSDAGGRLVRLREEVMKLARKQLDEISTRYAARRLDLLLKEVADAQKDLPALIASYNANLANIDLTKIFTEFRIELEARINNDDLPGVLALYDNKGLAALAAAQLDIKGPRALFEKTGRLLGDRKGDVVRAELVKVLPAIS